MASVIQPNLGLILDRAPIAIANGGLRSGRNFAIRDSKLTNLNIGWERFGSFQLNGPVTGIAQHTTRLDIQRLILGTPTDLYLYVDASTVTYLTPIYATGTIAVSGTTVTGSGGANFTTGGIKAGDQLAIGASDENSPAATWYTVDSVTSATELELTTAPTAGTGLSYTIRKLFSGSLDAPWEWDMFIRAGVADDDLLFLTNGVDPIVKWDGVTDTVEEAGITLRARALTRFKNMLVLTGTTDGGSEKHGDIANSDVGEPEDFSGGLASQLRAHDGADPIVALKQLGDSLVIYTKRRVILADFIGDPFVWLFRTISNRTGSRAGRLVADFGDYHKFIGTDTQYIFDGSNVQPTGDHVWRRVLATMDESRVGRGFAHFIEEDGELLWSVALNTDSNLLQLSTTWVEHYLESVRGARGHVSFSVRDFPFTASGYYVRQGGTTWESINEPWESYNIPWNARSLSVTFPLSLAGDASGKLFVLNSAQKGDGEPLPSFVRTGRLATGDGQMRACVARVHPYGRTLPQTTLDVRLWLAESAHETATDGGAFPISLAFQPGDHFVSPFRVARFVELAFESDGSPWELAGWNMDVRVGGMR